MWRSGRSENAGIWTRGQGGRTGRERRGAGRERKKGRARGGFPIGGLGRRPEGPEVPWRFPVSLEVSVAPGMPLRRSPEVFGGALMQQKTNKSLTRARELGSAIFSRIARNFPEFPRNPKIAPEMSRRCPGGVPEVSRRCPGGVPEVSRRCPGGVPGGISRAPSFPRGWSRAPGQFGGSPAVFHSFCCFFEFRVCFLLEGCAAGGGGDPLGFKQFQGGPKGSSWPRGGPSIFSVSILIAPPFLLRPLSLIAVLVTTLGAMICSADWAPTDWTLIVSRPNGLAGRPSAGGCLGSRGFSVGNL